MAPFAIKRFTLPWLSTWTGRRNCWARGWLKRKEPSSGSATSTNSRHRRRLWSERYPAILPGWARNWDRLKPFFGYPPAIRNAVYTTNAIESLSCSLRKVSKGRGAFAHDDAIKKLLYLGLRNVSKKWTMPILDRKAELNQFIVLYGDRVPV